MNDVDQAIASASDDTVALWSGKTEDSGLSGRIRSKRMRLELTPDAVTLQEQDFARRIEESRQVEDQQLVAYQPRAPPAYRLSDSRKRQAYEITEETVPPQYRVQELIDEDFEYAPAHPQYRLPHDEL